MLFINLFYLNVVGRHFLILNFFCFKSFFRPQDATITTPYRTAHMSSSPTTAGLIHENVPQPELVRRTGLLTELQNSKLSLSRGVDKMSTHSVLGSGGYK